MIWRSKFTDLINNAKTQSLGKMTVDKSARIKADSAFDSFSLNMSCF